MKKIAIDCEMVGDVNNFSMLARVSLVDENGRKIYDSFCKPKRPVVYYRTELTGITETHLKNAPQFSKVQNDVRSIITNCVWLGHSVNADITVLEFQHPLQNIIDIAELPKFKDRNGQKRSLKDLAKEFLGVIIQEPYHDSLEDAKIAMQLYKKFYN